VARTIASVSQGFYHDFVLMRRIKSRFDFETFSVETHVLHQARSQVIRFGGAKHLSGRQDFRFYLYVLMNNFLGTTKFGGNKKLGDHCPRMPPGTGLATTELQLTHVSSFADRTTALFLPIQEEESVAANRGSSTSASCPGRMDGS